MHSSAAEWIRERVLRHGNRRGADLHPMADLAAQEGDDGGTAGQSSRFGASFGYDLRRLRRSLPRSAQGCSDFDSV